MKKISVLTVLFLLVSVVALADYPPLQIQVAFQKMYPEATEVEWEKKGDYFIAEFIKDSHEIDVWFDTQSQWIMTETDVESLEEIPVPVAKAFTKSTLAAMRLNDIRVITFPKQPTVVVIDVEGYNSDEEYQVFYALNGTLLQTLDVSVTGGEIYPGLFE